MKKTFVFLVFIAFISFQACKDKNPVVLKINGIEFRKDEIKAIVEKQKNNFEIQYKSKFTKTEFNEWLNSFIEKQLLKQLVFQKGYDKQADVIYASSVVNKAIIAQMHGEYYNVITEKNMRINNEDIEIGRERTLYTYKFKSLQFDSRKQIKEILGADSICKSLNDFNRIAIKAARKGIKCDTVKVAWPFDCYLGLVHTIENMNVGDITKPMKLYDYPYSAKYSIIAMIDKSPIPNLKKEEIKNEYLYCVYQEYTKRLIFNQLLYKYYEESNFNINSKIIKQSFNLLRYSESGDIDSISLKPIYDSIVLKYSLHNTIHNFTVHNFLDFYKNLPIKSRFKSEKDFSEYFQDVVVFDYIWDDATKQGFVNTKQYVKNINKVVQNTAMKKYLNDNVYSKIKISDDEVKAQYIKDSTLLIHPNVIKYDLLVFKTYELAFKFFDKISKMKNMNIPLLYENTFNINGLLEVKKGNNIKFDQLGENRYSDNLNQLFNMQQTQVFQYNKFYALAIKTQEIGKIKTPYEQVKIQLYETVKRRKSDEKYKALLLKIKNNASIFNKVQFTDYFN